MNDSRVEEHRNLGVAFYKAAMLDEALREFRRVADLRPTEASAPFFLGLIALRQGRWEEAVEAFRQAIEKGGAKAAALHNLGLALERLGRLDEAEAAYGDAAGRSRDDPRIMLGWSVVALKRGDYSGGAGPARPGDASCWAASRHRRSGTGPRRWPAPGWTTSRRRWRPHEPGPRRSRAAPCSRTTSPCCSS